MLYPGAFHLKHANLIDAVGPRVTLQQKQAQQCADVDSCVDCLLAKEAELDENVLSLGKGTAFFLTQPDIIPSLRVHKRREEEAGELQAETSVTEQVEPFGEVRLTERCEARGALNGCQHGVERQDERVVEQGCHVVPSIALTLVLMLLIQSQIREVLGPTTARNALIAILAAFIV